MTLKVISDHRSEFPGKSVGHQVECIIENNLESHNFVQNIAHESTNGGP